MMHESFQNSKTFQDTHKDEYCKTHDILTLD